MHVLGAEARQVRAGNESPTRVVKFNLHGPQKFRFGPKPILPIAAVLAPATFEQLVGADIDGIDEILAASHVIPQTARPDACQGR